jgi:hypothetical protein
MTAAVTRCSTRSTGSKTSAVDNRYLMGDQMTEADWRLFTTLVRFDPVYHLHFKCNRKRVIDYPNLWAYTRELYQWPGVADTVNFDHIVRHYHYSHESINPHRIIPINPVIDWRARRRGVGPWRRAGGLAGPFDGDQPDRLFAGTYSGRGVDGASRQGSDAPFHDSRAVLLGRAGRRRGHRRTRGQRPHRAPAHAVAGSSCPDRGSDLQ